MPPTIQQLQRVMARLRSNRRNEQLDAVRTLASLGSSSAGRQTLIAAGGLAALLQCASNSEPSVAEWALAVLNALAVSNTLSGTHADSEQASADWRAAMLAGQAVALLLGPLESRHTAVQDAAIVAAGLLASGAETAAAAALVQHGAATLLVSLVRHTRCPRVRNHAAAALRELSCVPAVADALLRSGTVEVLAPLLLSDAVTEETQTYMAWALGSLAASSEQCGAQVVRAGGIRALVRAVAGGSTSVAEAAVSGLLDAATEGATAVWTAVVADGGIPVLEAFCRNYPHSEEAQDARELLSEMHSAQQAQQEAQQVHSMAENSSGAGSGAASQPPSPQPATTSRAGSIRLPHNCAW